MIEVKLNSNETLNPLGSASWRNDTLERKDRVSEKAGPPHDRRCARVGSGVADNILTEAIARTYKRLGLHYANLIPMFSELRDELAEWQDEEKIERAVDEAKLAAINLRVWTETDIYSRLFDRHTNIRTDNN